MAVTRGATLSTTDITGNTTDGSITHTVDSGTTLLLVYIGTEGGESISGTPQWSLGGGEDLTLIRTFGASSDAADCIGHWYGRASPTAGAGTVTITFASNVNPAVCLAANYIGTESASVAAATNFLSEDINDTATATNVHASAGNAGNCLVVGTHFQGNDGATPTDDASMFDVFNSTTGPSSNADFTYFWGDILNAGGATAVTVTYQATDENTGAYIELVAAAVGNITRSPGVGSLTLTGFVPTLIQTFSIAVPVGSLTLTGQTPIAVVNTIIAVPVGSLTLTGLTPTVEISHVAVPAVGTLVLTGQIPALVQTDNHIRAPPLGSLTLTGFAPSVNITQAIDVPVGSLTLTGQAPTAIQTFSVDIPVGSAAFTGFAPTTIQTFSIPVPVGSLTLTGLAPTLSITELISVPLGSLSLTGFAPTVIQTFSIDVPVGSLTLTGQLPTATQDSSISVPVGSLTLTGLTPTAEQSFIATPGVGSLTLTGQVPVAALSGADTTITPGVGSLVATGLVPTVTINIAPTFGLFNKVTLTGEFDFTQLNLKKEDGFNLLKEDGGLLLIRSDAIVSRTASNTYFYAKTLMEDSSFIQVTMTSDLFTSVRIP